MTNRTDMTGIRDMNDEEERKFGQHAPPSHS